MYIDTYTRDGMEKSICDIFQLHPLELRERLIMIDRVQCKDLDKHYMKNSTYYCYEYKLPLSTVMFDDHDTYSDSLKQKYLISCVLQRLYRYQTSNPRYMFDHDNPILRLPDDYTIPSNYYVGREMITLDMLE